MPSQTWSGRLFTNFIKRLGAEGRTRNRYPAAPWAVQCGAMASGRLPCAKLRHTLPSGKGGPAARRCTEGVAMFLVTGGAGFIGSNLVAALNDAGHADIVVN